MNKTIEETRWQYKVALGMLLILEGCDTNDCNANDKEKECEDCPFGKLCNIISNTYGEDIRMILDGELYKFNKKVSIEA